VSQRCGSRLGEFLESVEAERCSNTVEPNRSCRRHAAASDLLLGPPPLSCWRADSSGAKTSTATPVIDQLAGRLSAAYQHVDRAGINRVVLEEYARFEGRPIRDFIPLFVERNACRRYFN
jgi:hypothetical protein